jgi:hypothetical protein
MLELFIQGLFVLGFFGELYGDMVLVLKIFTLMAIFAYVTQHLGKGPLAIIIILFMSWFIIFDYFAFFGGIYVLYILMAFGFTGVIIDFFFVNPGSGQENKGGVSSGKDLMSRQKQISQAQQMMRR